MPCPCPHHTTSCLTIPRVLVKRPWAFHERLMGVSCSMGSSHETPMRRPWNCPWAALTKRSRNAHGTPMGDIQECSWYDDDTLMKRPWVRVTWAVPWWVLRCSRDAREQCLWASHGRYMSAAHGTAPEQLTMGGPWTILAPMGILLPVGAS